MSHSTDNATFLANDLVVLENECNLSCKYCLTGQSTLKPQHQEGRIFGPPRQAVYTKDSPLGRRLAGILDALDGVCHVPILKVTGGELFWIRNIMEFLRGAASRYDTLVVQTNGVLLREEECSEIASWGNACLQISIDAFSWEGNAYRAKNERQHALAVSNITRALDSGIPTEIYIVLTDRSLPWLQDTLERLKPYAGNVIAFPFPVRGPGRNDFLPRPEQLAFLDTILDRFDDFHSILPPRPYCEQLRDFLATGKRKHRCHLTRFVFSTFDDGVFTPCPNVWFSESGNLLKESPAEILKRSESSAFVRLLRAHRPRLDACSSCFTPWEILTLYAEGLISLDELARSPMFRAKRTRDMLARYAVSDEECRCSP